MTPEEQARERAREWKTMTTALLGHWAGQHDVTLREACWDELVRLVISISDEARQEERKRCEEIVARVLNRELAMNGKTNVTHACDEILRRMGEP